MNGTDETVQMGDLRPQPSRREQIYEILVFWALIIPGMAFAYAVGPAEEMRFSIAALATMTNDIALVLLICFLLWHNRESLVRIGWVVKGFWTEILIGFLLFFPMTFGAGLLENLFRSMGLTVPKGHLPSFLTPSGGPQMVLAAALVVVVAISEETIFRGYFLLRLNNVTKNRVAAVLISSLIFSIGHGYEGTAGVATVYVMGVIFAVVYMWRKSLVAPIVMHFMQDFSGIVLLPLIAGK